MNIDWIWVENIRSPSIFSLPLMNSIGPAALPVTSRRKSTPSRAQGDARLGWGALLVGAGAVASDDLPMVDAAVGPPVIFQWITASTPAALPRLEVLLHAPEHLADDLPRACGPLHGLAQLLVGGLTRSLRANSSGSIDDEVDLLRRVLRRLAHRAPPPLIAIRAPEIAREITSRWISDVPSKIV